MSTNKYISTMVLLIHFLLKYLHSVLEVLDMQYRYLSAYSFYTGTGTYIIYVSNLRIKKLYLKILHVLTCRYNTSFIEFKK